MLPDASTLLHWVSLYGYPCLGAVLLLGAAGLPIPIELVLLALGGLSATRGGPDFLILVGMGVAATVAGDLLDYGFGRLMCMRGIARLPCRRVWGRWRNAPTSGSASRGEQVVRRLAEWGGSGVMIFLSRCVLTPLETPLSVVAGATRMPFTRFLVWDALGEAVYVTGYLALGFTGAAALATSGPLLIAVGGAIVLATLGPLVVVRLVVARTRDERPEVREVLPRAA